MSNYKDLIERCKEICAWQDTGLLKGDALRNFAASRPYAQQHNAVSIAQAETLREVADAFIASVDRIAELESSLAATSDMVNKAFADGKAEGHGDATAEASVVIGELRARVAELEAWRNAVLDELVSLNIACQEPALYVQTDHFAQARTAPFLARVFQQPIEGVATLPFYAAPPVTAPVRITDEQVEHALRTNGAYESDAAYAMAKDGLLTDARAVETAVLRANGFKVEG